MIAIGIDVSKGHSTVSAVAEGKKVIQKPYDVKHNKTELSKLIDFIKKYDEETCVVMEHTGVYYRIVAETLHAAGIRVSAVNPVLIHQFGNNTLRKVRTDPKDSVKIAKYTLENREDLRDYSTTDTIRDDLKSFIRQFSFENKTLTAHKNSLGAMLERVFPGIDGIFSFSNPAKANGHLKIVDFIIEFWHNDCVSLLTETKFIEKYRKFCKKNRYNFNESTAKEIYALSRENLTSMGKTDTAKLLVQGAAKRVLYLSETVENLRAEMIKLAKKLPEFPAVIAIYGVGESLAAQLIGEIGDVRRFESKRALVAFAGVDPDKDDSGKKVSATGKISRSGNAMLRKVVYQAVECYLLNSPADEPVYQFLDKKRSEGKHFYVYMTAACNKFLRIYYARVKEFMDSLEAETSCSNSDNPAGSSKNLSIDFDLGDSGINTTLSVKNITAFACEQDSAMLENNTSGLQDFGLYG
jgi:transposase